MPAGSAVAVEGPVRRKFEATESPTTLIVVGGTPGKAYAVGERGEVSSRPWPVGLCRAKRGYPEPDAAAARRMGSFVGE